jgi:Uri superfamily endonuclease
MLIPACPGLYALWLRLPQTARLLVGQLGEFDFPAGDYIYLGSARGPGGLRARLGRHLRGDGWPHWHIDSLRAVARPQAVWFAVDDRVIECDWVQVLGALSGAVALARGFGARDCRRRCPTHLIYFQRAEPALITRVLEGCMGFTYSPITDD